jgi:hypothetical protein
LVAVVAGLITFSVTGRGRWTRRSTDVAG